MSEMSSFWSGWIIVLTVGNVVACFWLVWWTMRKRPDEASSGDVTGHTWDGDLQEYNNPLPRWWLWLFYITLVFAVLYFFLYPGLGNVQGFLNWTKESQYEAEVAAANEKYGPIFAQYREVAVEDLAKNPEAVAMGQRMFLTYCMQCHGSAAAGGPGFPNLTDKDWQWGGSPDQIKATIVQGRQAAMPGWQAVLGDEGVDQVVAYVLSLSGRSVDEAKAQAGKPLYDTNCAACHTPAGTGMQALGAPNLTDDVWLYGGSPGAVKHTIVAGRNGVMPAFNDLLGEDKIHLLTAYVYSLSD